MSKKTRKNCKKINIIVAHDANNGIGKDGKLIIKSKRDMRFFTSMTIGNAVIMGRKTFESIGRKLKGRTNCVITRDKNYKSKIHESIKVYHSLEDAIKDNLDNGIFIIGGESLYREALEKKLVTGVYKTVFDTVKIADAFFPTYYSDKQIKKIAAFDKDDENESSGTIYFHKIRDCINLDSLDN